MTRSSHDYTTVLTNTTVVQRFCDGLYGYDTVWSAKRIYFTPAAEQLSVIMMSTKRKKKICFCLPPVADYEENKTQEEEEGLSG